MSNGSHPPIMKLNWGGPLPIHDLVQEQKVQTKEFFSLNKGQPSKLFGTFLPQNSHANQEEFFW